MRFAVIGDIHSNVAALEAVLADIMTKDADFIVSTGDIVGYAPFPNETIALLRQRGVLSIQGNYDRAIGNEELVCGCDYKDERQLALAGASMLFTNNAISETNREYLRKLPCSIMLQVDGFKVLVVHGSPRRINEYLYEESAALQEVTASLEEDVLICGHTHIPYHAVVNGKRVINSGSVGKPKHGRPHATYVIAEVGVAEVRVEICEAPYDVELTARAIEANEVLPDDFAALIRRGG